MALITLNEAKNYLRVDTSDDDALIGVLLSSACRLCADVARLTDEQRAVVDGGDDEDELYTEDELSHVQEIMKMAILYSIGYLYEHREEADHRDLTITLRSLLFAIREGVW